MNSLEIISHHRLVAIIRLDDLSSAVELSRALLAGGIVAQEFTLTNPLALQAVTQVLEQIESFRNGQATIGVGSVRTRDQASAAIAAGAQFVVSPVVNRAVSMFCVAKSVPIFSGAMTPTEIASAWEMGSAMVKVFPARSLGASYIKDVLAPMPELKLMPTGGIDLTNMREYFDAGASAVGVGGNLIDSRAMAAGDWGRIASVAQQYAAQAAKGACQ